MYYVRMTNSKSAPKGSNADPKAEVVGYGYLSDAERAVAISAHERAVAKNANK